MPCYEYYCRQCKARLEVICTEYRGAEYAQLCNKCNFLMDKMISMPQVIQNKIGWVDMDITGKPVRVNNHLHYEKLLKQNGLVRVNDEGTARGDYYKERIGKLKEMREKHKSYDEMGIPEVPKELTAPKIDPQSEMKLSKAVEEGYMMAKAKLETNTPAVANTADKL